MERKALGKGISALIPDTKTQDKEEKISYIKLELIAPNPYQPRGDFDSAHLEELIQSVKEKGVLQPIILRRKAGSYELIAGERRLRAAKALNLIEIPAIIRDIDDSDSLELSLIENLQRQDLNPIEEALAFKFLIEKFNFTQEKISAVLGKARTTIANVLRLLKLPQEIQEELKKGGISFAHGRALLELEDPNQQRHFAQEIIRKRLSVRELENLIKKVRPKCTKAQQKTSAKSPYIAVLEEELQRILATRVKINQKKKRGQVLIEFYSQEDLERIAQKIRGE